MKIRLMLGILAISSSLVTMPAFADRGDGRGHKHQSDRVSKVIVKHRDTKAANGRWHKNQPRQHKKVVKRVVVHRPAGFKHAKPYRHDRVWHDGRGKRVYRNQYIYRNDNSNEKLITGLIIGGIVGSVLANDHVWNH